MADRAADEQIDDLYDLEPGEFTVARNALAKRLKGEGHKEVAAAVAKLRRPTLVAWAINQVARRQPEALEALIDAAAAVATAQRDLLAGGQPADLRAARYNQRMAAGVVVRAAAITAGGNHGDAITATVDAALADAELVERLQAGTLSETLDAPSGFGFALDTDPGPPAPRRRRGTTATPAHPKATTKDDGVGNDGVAAEAAVAAQRGAARGGSGPDRTDGFRRPGEPGRRRGRVGGGRRRPDFGPAAGRARRRGPPGRHRRAGRRTGRGGGSRRPARRRPGPAPTSAGRRRWEWLSGL